MPARDPKAWSAAFRARNRVKLRRKRMAYYYRLKDAKAKQAKQMPSDPLTLLTCVRFA